MILTSLIADLVEAVRKKSTSTKIALMIKCLFWREFRKRKKKELLVQEYAWFTSNWSGEVYSSKA